MNTAVNTVINAPSGWTEGVRLFNAGEYWEAHEALELPWMIAEGLQKHLYAGVILLAAALHKAHKMNNARGGRRNYAKALAHLALLPDIYEGLGAQIEIRKLEAEVHAALQDASLRPQLPFAKVNL